MKHKLEANPNDRPERSLVLRQDFSAGISGLRYPSSFRREAIEV